MVGEAWWRDMGGVMEKRTFFPSTEQPVRGREGVAVWMGVRAIGGRAGVARPVKTGLRWGWTFPRQLR